MALNRKHSRRIVLGEEAYRYKVSATSPDEDRNYRLNVTLQREAGGSRLEVRGLVTRDFWLDISGISDPGKIRSEDYPAVMPRHIRTIIELAIKAGWQPQMAGPSLVLKLNNEELFSI